MCNKPISIKNRRGQQVAVPCGSCAECLAKFREQWFIRLKTEKNYYLYSWFITFTYDDDNLPWGKYPSLYKRDIQNLLKRVRKHPQYTVGLFKYYCVGEYGTQFKRPHYHMIVLSNEVISFEGFWNKGRVQQVPLNDKEINYVCKYHVLRGDHPPGTEKPFSLSSKGIGKLYAERHRGWHNNDPYKHDFIYVDGKKKPIPRYIKEKLFDKRTIRGLSAINRERAMKKMIREAPKESEKNYFVNKFHDTNYKNLNFKKKSERGGSL